MLLEFEGASASVTAVTPKIVNVLCGLGDKTGFLDKRCYAYEMWNTDDPDPRVDSFKALYKSIPFSWR